MKKFIKRSAVSLATFLSVFTMMAPATVHAGPTGFGGGAGELPAATVFFRIWACMCVW